MMLHIFNLFLSMLTVRALLLLGDRLFLAFVPDPCHLVNMSRFSFPFSQLDPSSRSGPPSTECTPQARNLTHLATLMSCNVPWPRLAPFSGLVGMHSHTSLSGSLTFLGLRALRTWGR
jgi:hypothetical protein